MSDSRDRKVVGVTGLPCSGKSYAAHLLAEGRVTGSPCLLVKADDLGHLVLSFPEVRDTLGRRFGDEVFRDPDDRAVRRHLAERVFSSPKDLAWLESVMHPLVVRETQRLIRDALEDVAVVEAALLFAAGMDEMCDIVLLVEAKKDVRQRRALARGWDADELARRERRLAPLFSSERLEAVGDKLVRICNETDAETLVGEMRSVLR